LSNFLHGLAPEVLSRDDKLSPDGRGQGHVTVMSSFFGKKVLISRKGARHRYTYNGRLIGNSKWPIKS